MADEKKLAGWYRINDRNHFQYFDGENFRADNFEIISVSSDIKFFIGPERKPRNRAFRFVYILGSLVGIFFLIFGLSLFGGSSFSETFLDVYLRLLVLIIMAFLCQKVGYRWFDTFLSLIPIYGAFFICKIAWRASVLPHRYWSIRHIQSSEELKNPLTGNSLDSVPRIFSKKAKIAISGLVILPGVLLVLNASGAFTSIACNGLKKEINNQDTIGRELWNSYQDEVSRLNSFPMYSNQYYNQVSNVARRILQVLEYNRDGYQLMLENPQCLNEQVADLQAVINRVDELISFLKVENKGFNAENFDKYDGWNTDFYNRYVEMAEFLK